MLLNGLTKKGGDVRMALLGKFYGVNQFEYSDITNEYSQEASMLGLQPGEWPNYVHICTSDKGVLRSFTFSRLVHSENKELIGAEYTCNTGVKLIILND
jgi:hypothetical protein